MIPAKPILIAAAFLLTAFAGCSSEDDVLSAAFVVTPVDAEKTMFRFDAGSSTGKGLKFSWYFGDRTEPKSGEVVQHAYEYPNGEYTVTLTVTDSAGATKKATQPVSTGSGQNEAPLLYLSVDKRRAVPDEEIFFDGSQSVDPDGDPIFFIWDFNSDLGDDVYADMENLGSQAYGRYPANKPPPSGGDGANGTGSESTSSSSGLTPSGHDLQREVEEARVRLYERLGWDQLHGGEPGAAEPRNGEYDGRINDTSPVQFHTFPANAVYYVHVRVEDIKGAGQEGFIKISIEDTVPPMSNSTTVKGQLKPGPISPVQGTIPSREAQTFSSWAFRYEFPATSNMTLRYTREGSQGDEMVAVYVCAKATPSECQTPKAKLDKGAPGRTLSWTVGPEETLAFTYYVIVANEGNAIVNFDFTVGTVFDTNPWAKDEAGFGGAHH